MQIAVLNDTHFGARGNSDVIFENQREFFTKVFFPTLKERGIKQILHLGDLYDNRKSISVRTQHEARKMFLDPLRDNGLLMDIVPGNHDVYYKSTNSLNSLKEMLGYFLNNIHIIESPEMMVYGSMEIGLVPWINQENEEECLRFIQSKCRSNWLAGHFEIVGFDMMRGVKATHGMDSSIFDRYEQVLSGHYHSGSERGNIRYLGSQNEFTWADAHDPKYFHIIETDTREIEQVRNPYTLFHKMYYDENDGVNEVDPSSVRGKYVKVMVVHKSGDTNDFDQFVQQIQDAGAHDLKIVENLDGYLGENVQINEDTDVQVDDTPTLIDSYVESVSDTDLDKDRLKQMMREVYIEAQSEECSA